MIEDVPDADAIYNFRGKTTIFGAPSCDSDINCKYDEIIQYDPDDDRWVKLGNMLEPRLLHAVIEVPVEFCDSIATSTTSSAPTTEQSTSTRPTQSTSTPPPETFDTVAMVIGGVSNPVGGGILSDVELFGCPDLGNNLITVDDFPTGIFLTSGVHLPVDGMPGSVVVCGGEACVPGTSTCDITGNCFQWTPQNQWQRFGADLTTSKYLHLMALAPDLEDENADGGQVPLVLGLNRQTEIYNRERNEWRPYKELGTNNWISIECLFQHGDSIWHMRQSIYELNTLTWITTEYGPLPDRLSIPGRCAFSEIDGRPGTTSDNLVATVTFVCNFLLTAGILLRNGFWFDIGERKWQQRRFPPFPNFIPEPNAIYSFRGKPTVFGNLYCDVEVNCDYSQVIQYDAESGDWIDIGKMKQGRAFHTVIEVPMEFCQSDYVSATEEPFTTTEVTTTEEPFTTTEVTTTEEPFTTTEVTTTEPSTTEATTLEPSTTEATTPEPSTTEATTPEPSTTEATTAGASTTTVGQGTSA